MRRYRNVVLWAALPFVVVPLLTTAPAMAANASKALGTDSVTVYRPGDGTEVRGTMRVEGGVTVYRGVGAVKPTSVGLTKRKRGRAVVGGGEDIWFVDAFRNRLVNCRVRSTSTVGRDVIRCTRRRLP